MHKQHAQVATPVPQRLLERRRLNHDKVGQLFMKECKDGRVLWDLRVSLDTRVSYPGIYTSYSTNSRILRTSCVTAVSLYIRRQSCAPGNDQCCINRYIIPGVLHLITMYSDRGHTPHLFVIYFEVAMHRAWLLCDEFQKMQFRKKLNF